MFKFLDTHTYNMPCHFGGSEGSGISVYYNDNTDISVSYETEMDALEKYVHEDFEIVLPIIHVSFVFCHEVDFLAGGCYNIAQAVVPVRYKKTKEPIDGVYPLVVWENKTDPILGGREQSGVPKIYCDISEYQVVGDHIFSTASYNGTDFLRIDFKKKETLTREEVEKRNENSKVNLLGWPYSEYGKTRGGSKSCYPVSAGNDHERRLERGRHDYMEHGRMGAGSHASAHHKCFGEASD